MSASWKIGLLFLALFAWAAAGSAEEKTAGGDVTGSQVTAKPSNMERLGDVQVSSTKGPFYYHNEYELRCRKLARGLANVVLCPAEVPNQMFREAYKSSPIGGAVVGACKGVYKGFKRLAIGTWEVVTFYYPANNNYQPFIEPEIVFMEYVH